MVGNDVVAEEAATVFGDEDVVFQSDTAKILVGLHQFVVDEVLVQSLRTPIVDEVGNEIDARFIGHDKSFLQTLAAAQGIGAELCAGLYLFVEADVVLSESFHIVNIETHHVAKTMR